MRFYTFLSLFILSLSGPLQVYAQGGGCTCTNCPQFMQDLFVGNFVINVQGATNNTLGQNGQAVCGVHVTWDHTAICDLSFTLTSPSGQSLTLVGPIGQFCQNMGNTGTVWDVTFVPCTDAAMPDPGFTAQWNNNQNWGANNTYTGSYYPFVGCLENFSGPVNGNWTLTVTDGQANDVGNLLNFEVIFCDPSGINCISCVADAGILPQPDVAGCEGSSDLALDLPPVWNPPAVEPPASDYTYSYVIGGAGGVIQAINGSADMTGFSAGNYTICGLSYYSGHQNLLPMPGSLTLAQLTTQLNSNTPPFCGDVTSNCVNVLIYPIPPDEEEFATICSPNCYDFQGNFYCQTGDFIVPLTDNNGCAYNSILHLKVNPPSLKTINEVICAGECSSNPSFPGACITGTYQATLTNSQGCDSVLTLNLTVLNVQANIVPPGNIGCGQGSVTLSGVGSTIGAGTSYLWTAGNGGHLSGPNNQLITSADAPGTYHLRVCRTAGGATCCDSATVTVLSSATLPAAPVITGSPFICQDSTQTYSIHQVNSATGYTWTLPPGVVLVNSIGDTTLQVRWDTTASDPICVVATNACGPGPQTCLNVTVVQTPAPPVITGNNIVCQDSLSIYSLDSIPGALSYHWTATGGLIQSGADSTTVSVLWNGGAGHLCATAANGCGTSLPTCIDVTVNRVPATAMISGDSTLCSGNTGNYAIQALAGATGYVWTVPAGATILSGQNSTAVTVDWANTGGGNICVQGVNACGNGLNACLTVQVLQQPVAQAGADSSLCGTSSMLHAISSVSGSSGLWSQISGPGTSIFTNPALPITGVTVNANGTYHYLWQESNGMCSDRDTVQVNFNSIPVGGMIQHVCDGSNQNYTVSFNISGGTAPYTVSGGGNVNGSTFTSMPVPSGQAFSFTITDAAACVSLPLTGMFNCNCSTNAGQMNQQILSVCPGDSIFVTASTGVVFDADDTGAFVLHTNSGGILGTVLAENTSGVFGFVAGMQYETTYYVSYVAGNNMNGLPDPNDPCLSVAPGQPVIFHDYPPVDAGPDQSGCGTMLTVSGNPGTGMGLWTIVSSPPGGTAMIANPQQASTIVTSSLPGMYAMAYTVTLNGCAASDTVELNYGTGPIATNVQTACNAGNTQYTVSFSISGGASPYSVNGQPLAAASYVSAPINSGGNYSFTITDVNGCASVPVIGSFNCSCASNAGQMAQTTITACPDDTIHVQFLGGQNLDGNDILAYILHAAPANSLNGILSENTTGSFLFTPGMTYGVTYYVSAVVGNNQGGYPDINDPCLSVSAGQPVVFLQNPQPNAGVDLGACGLTAFLHAANGLYPGAWTMVSGPGTVTFLTPQNPNCTATASALGHYVFRWTEANGACMVFDDVNADYLPNPSIDSVSITCNSTNTGYTIRFDVLNSAAPFTISGLTGTFTGNHFVSNELPNNSNYSFSVMDPNGCQSLTQNGNHLCPCTTNAGTMDPAPLIFCADMPATAVWNHDATLDGDDTIQFILHNNPGALAGSIFAVNSQPEFNFAPPLLPNTTYYISAIAGSVNGNMVNLNDACLSVAPGTPVQWKPLPEAFISGDATICLGSSTNLSFNGTGAYPLDLVFGDGSGASQHVTLTNPVSEVISVSPATTTQYSLISVSDGTMPVCSATPGQSVMVTVSQPVTAGVAEPDFEICAGDMAPITLAALLNGEDAAGHWTEISAFPSGTGAFNAPAGIFNPGNQAAGYYQFKYTVTAPPPCPNESAVAGVVIHPTPVADAGLDQLINCHQDTAVLGGPATSVGPGIHYQWRSGGMTLDSSLHYSATENGMYELLVTNSFGCTDTDQATLTVDNDIPGASGISIKNVRCFGENNGAIVIDSIFSNHPPVLISLNGDPFRQTTEFNNLAPNQYILTLQDANGCEWRTDTFTLTEPPLLKADLGGEITVVFGDSVRLDPMLNVAFESLSTITWNPLLDPGHADTLIQKFLPLHSVVVDLSVTDTGGCRTSDRVRVIVDKPDQVYIPNVIKPGSQQFNDKLVVYGGKGVQEVEYFRVFDRWGEKLFDASGFLPNDDSRSWDGTLKGQAVLPGVYVYVAMVKFIDGEEKLYKGDVTVLR